MIGAGFNLLVNRAEDEEENEEEDDAVDPLDWLNCAADKLANVAEDEAVMMHLRPLLSQPHRTPVRSCCSSH